MSNETQLALPPKQSALAVMAGKFNVEPNKLLDTLKSTVFKNATNEELLALVVVSNEYGLNPLTKEIYAFPAKGGGIVPVVSIDGWIRMMNDHPQFDGIDYEFEHDEEGRLVSCTSIIHRKDRSHPTRVTEYLAECKRNTEPWKMERRMLRHKATIQGARVAFGFSGITDEDEAAATPGLAREAPKAARAEPLDPFNGLPGKAPEVVEADFTEQPADEPNETDMLLQDFSEALRECQDAESLTAMVARAEKDFADPQMVKTAKHAINERAKAMNLKWSKAKGGFEQP